VAWSRLPILVRFMILHGALGFILSALFVGAFLWADPAGIGSLMLRGPDAPWVVLLLWFFTGLTFGGVQIGNAVMLLAEEDPPGGRGRLRRAREWLNLGGMAAPVRAGRITRAR
jgi:hypothetical protein